MFEEISGLRMAQADGDLPTVAAGRAPGESGVFVVSGRFHGMHISGPPRQHHVCFRVIPSAHLDCRIADQTFCGTPFGRLR